MPAGRVGRVTTWAATRRTALAGSVAGVAGALMAGCDTSTSPSPTGGGGPATGAAEDPDTALVDEAAARTRHVLALLVALPHRDRAAVAGLPELHRAHLGALDAPLPPAGHPARPTLAQVRGAEAALQRRLAHLAAGAESGPLARLLASMSAGIAAHLAADTKPHRASA